MKVVSESFNLCLLLRYSHYDHVYDLELEYKVGIKKGKIGHTVTV